MRVTKKTFSELADRLQQTEISQYICEINCLLLQNLVSNIILANRLASHSHVL